MKHAAIIVSAQKAAALSELNFLDNLYPILPIFVPGLVVMFVRAQFVTGRRPPHSESFLTYVTISLIYYALTLPLLDFVLSIGQPGYCRALAWITLTVLGPALVGLVLGINAQTNWFRSVLQRCGLNPVHVMPTAWDWKFGNMADQWVLVTLKDGTRFAGFCGQDSFVSSEPAERDIYIQWTYDIDEENNWISPGEKGVLIGAGEIQTIEFWPYTSEENADDREQ